VQLPEGHTANAAEAVDSYPDLFHTLKIISIKQKRELIDQFPFKISYSVQLKPAFSRNGKALSTFSPSPAQYFSAIGRFHSAPETVLVSSLSFGRLVCPFHAALSFNQK
jgi:hypothetical protein